MISNYIFIFSKSYNESQIKFLKLSRPKKNGFHKILCVKRAYTNLRSADR